MSISFRPCQTIPEDQDVVEDVVEGSFARNFLFVDFVKIFEGFFFVKSVFFTKGKVSLPVSLGPNTFSSSNKGGSCRSVFLKAMWEVIGYVRIFNTQSVRRIKRSSCVLRSWNSIV